MATCPQCSAAMEIATLGPMHDKVYRCGYCQFTRDIPDHYEETEERRSEDGRSYVRKTVIRRDLGDEIATPDGRGTRSRVTQEMQIESHMTTIHDELLRRVLADLPGQVMSVREVDPKTLRDLDLPEVQQVEDRADLREATGDARKTALWWGVAGAVLVALLFGSKALLAYCLGVGGLWWLVRRSRER